MKNVYQPHQLSDGRWVVGFGGQMSKQAAQAEVAQRNAAPACEPYAPYENPIFAIGGLSRGDGAESVMPMPKTGRVCRSCGHSESDGAMFTTDPGSGKCDDCQ